MKIAFTAPMKPLDHPVPSGDRTMGRLIVKALEAAGHDVSVASTFCSWRKHGGRDVQGEIKRHAISEADRIAAEWERSGYEPDIFLTYHLYHKAPDWIGPALSDRFGLPYAIVEASRAPKRKTGEWSFGFEAADAALSRADAVAAIQNADAECLRAVVSDDRLEVLLPFLDTTPFQEASQDTNIDNTTPIKLLAVGMMREGDKTVSYEVLAHALTLVNELPWRLTIIGDGPARDHILKLFPSDRTEWLGAQPTEKMPFHYARNDLVVWPAIREAFGFVFLEAQAAGRGVIAGEAFGVPDIVKDGETGLLSEEGNADAFAANLKRVIQHPEFADRMGRAAKLHIFRHHSLSAGAERLNGLIQKALHNHERRRMRQ